LNEETEKIEKHGFVNNTNLNGLKEALNTIKTKMKNFNK
jgi:hypothetical protein